jgi:hypothetical protein
MDHVHPTQNMFHVSFLNMLDYAQEIGLYSNVLKCLKMIVIHLCGGQQLPFQL